MHDASHVSHVHRRVDIATNYLSAITATSFYMPYLSSDRESTPNAARQLPWKLLCTFIVHRRLHIDLHSYLLTLLCTNIVNNIVLIAVEDYELRVQCSVSMFLLALT